MAAINVSEILDLFPYKSITFLFEKRNGIKRGSTVGRVDFQYFWKSVCPTVSSCCVVIMQSGCHAACVAMANGGTFWKSCALSICALTSLPQFRQHRKQG